MVKLYKAVISGVRETIKGIQKFKMPRKHPVDVRGNKKVVKIELKRRLLTNDLVNRVGVGEGDKAKAPLLAGVLVSHHVNVLNHTKLGEKLFQILLPEGLLDATYKYFLD